MQIVRTDRSRIETGLRCNRSRWWAYNHAGMGISPARTPLPLAVGSSVHEGLAELLRRGQALVDNSSPVDISAGQGWRAIEDAAVAVALADFATYRDALDVASERDGAAVVESQDANPAGAFGNVVYDDDATGSTRTTHRDGRSASQDYLYAEQAAMVEALVRAWSRRKLRPLLEEFEVLEVEREGEWGLAKWDDDKTWGEREIRFMSRPDALLRSRADNSLTILSFKTASGLDRRRLADTQRDMQGLTEGVEVERRLGVWWEVARQNADAESGSCPALRLDRSVRLEPIPKATWDYLRALPAPPRILAIRYEFLLKGERWRDADLAMKLNDPYARRQKSHLVYGYANPGMTAADEQWNWAYSYLKPDGSGETGKLYYKNWRPKAVWEGGMTVARWVDLLDGAAMAVSGDTGGELGYQCDAQATGYTRTHPLDDVVPQAVTVYRNEDDLRDCIEQIEAGERRCAENVAAVNAAGDDGERRSLLNQLWPMTRKACEWPSPCFAIPLCFGGEDIRRDPLSSKLYTIRVPNHPEGGNGNG